MEFTKPNLPPVTKLVKGAGDKHPGSCSSGGKPNPINNLAAREEECP